jgi:FMN-dependent NADH-azoreductase
MKNILLVQSSPRGIESLSQQVAHAIVKDLQAHYPEAKVVVRDLAENPPPHVGRDFVSGIHVQPEQLSREQSAAVALSDSLIAELSRAEVLVLAVPMYNFGLPSTLKAWIDYVVRAGRTFSHSPNGVEGLVKGKRAILVLARGGVYSEGPYKPFDFQEPYLRAILGFIGITDVEVVDVAGVAVSAIGPEKALASAATQSKQVLAHLA